MILVHFADSLLDGRIGRASSSVMTIAALVVLAAAPLRAQNFQTELESLTSTGAQIAAPGSAHAAMSGDARYVLFDATDPNVVPGDTNGASDVYLRDRQSGTVRRISVAPGGAQANGASFVSAMSGDGRFALILSSASNLVPNDTNGQEDLFEVDLTNGAVTRVNVSTQGAQSQGGQPLYGTLSRNGRRVAFASAAADLVAGDTNASPDVFVRDLDTGTTTRVSVDSNGAQGDAASGSLGAGREDSPFISATGRFVVFSSRATNLVPNDTNGSPDSADIFFHDTATGVTERVTDPFGVEFAHSNCGDGVISADGRYVAFLCGAPGASPGTLSEGVYVHDRVTGGFLPFLFLLSPTSLSGSISSLSMTPDGNILAVTGGFPPASVLLAWTYNLATGAVGILSVDQQNQVPATGDSLVAGISDDATAVLFTSLASGLVPNDANNAEDVFLRTRNSDSGRPYCEGLATTCPCGNAGAGIGGCENSHATGGAKLRASGLANVTHDSLSLIVTDTTPSTSALFIDGDAQVFGGTGGAFGSGLRCVGGNNRRIGTRQTENGTAWYGKVAGDTPVSVQSLIPVAGTTRYYQVLYRDAASTCIGTMNLSNGVSVTWRP